MPTGELGDLCDLCVDSLTQRSQKATWCDSAEILVEELERPLPRELGRRLVVARRRVVVEAVLGAFVLEFLERLVSAASYGAMPAPAPVSMVASAYCSISGAVIFAASSALGCRP